MNQEQAVNAGIILILITRTRTQQKCFSYTIKLPPHHIFLSEIFTQIQSSDPHFREVCEKLIMSLVICMRTLQMKSGSSTC